MRKIFSPLITLLLLAIFTSGCKLQHFSVSSGYSTTHSSHGFYQNGRYYTTTTPDNYTETTPVNHVVEVPVVISQPQPPVYYTQPTYYYYPYYTSSYYYQQAHYGEHHGHHDSHTHHRGHHSVHLGYSYHGH